MGTIGQYLITVVFINAHIHEIILKGEVFVNKISARETEQWGTDLWERLVILEDNLLNGFKYK